MTTRPCHGTHRSHINQVVLDTQTWERSACFWLEQSEAVAYYVRNDHLGFGYEGFRMNTRKFLTATNRILSSDSRTMST